MKSLNTVSKSIEIFFAAFFAIFLLSGVAYAEQGSAETSAVSVGKLLSNADAYSDTVVVQGYVKEVMAEDDRIRLADPHHAHMGTAESCPKKGYHAQDKYHGKKGSECPKYASKNDTDDKVAKCPVTGKKCEMPCKETCNEVKAKACEKSGISKSLTVAWNGDMPDVSEPVSVTGKLVQKDGQLIFEATSVTVLN